MMSGRRQKGRKNRRPHRFPRLIEGQEAAALEKLLWVPPNFEVQLKRTKKGTLTRLVFSIPMAPDFETSFPGLHRLIFESRANEWENAIADGYWKSKYNNKPLSKFVQGVLRRAFKNGVKNFLEEEWSLPGASYKAQIVQELSDFDKHAIATRGPRPNPQIAFWAAKRFNTLVPAIRGLRAKFKGNIPHNRPQELKTEIAKLCSYKTYVGAFRSLLPEGKVTPWDIRNEHIHPRAIALAIIECELPKQGYTIDVKQGTLWKHIQLGKKLIALFNFQPAAPSSASS